MRRPHVILKIYKVYPYTIYSRVYSIGVDLINFKNYMGSPMDFTRGCKIIQKLNLVHTTIWHSINSLAFKRKRDIAYLNTVLTRPSLRESKTNQT